MVNKPVNYHLKNLSNCLKTNKIPLNVGKTELVLFASPKKQLDSDMETKLNEKRLYKSDSVKYLGIQIDKNLFCKQQINHVTNKPIKANGMLLKLRHILDKKTLRSVYYATFESHLYYASFVCAQNTYSVNRLHLAITEKFSQNNFSSEQNFSYKPFSPLINKNVLVNCILLANL